ncbi:hypothetical protein QBC40DRAFT_316637 [Triangularia verruculosa]|uniref:2EXR domain-containing protein n=1 Tax=Triangularia verruculosa TaxID=2587418 RepID=A0AAN7AQZ9_9PEZI|nr:hypothetical protein QBC40DRAFT_316637 [Triangularia verruculosa]
MMSGQSKEKEASRPGPLGLQNILTEIRLKIYRLTWEPRVVVVDIPEAHQYPPFKTRYFTDQRSPVTLLLNSEARQETKKHYYQYLFSYRRENGSMKSAFGYVNPHLDTIHLDSTMHARFKPTNLRVIGLDQPLLQITLCALMEPYRVVRIVQLQQIRTIDFWLGRDDRPLDEHGWHIDIARYRLCRTAGGAKTALTTYNMTRWEAQRLPDFMCPEAGCKNRREAWGWKYAANQELTPVACPRSEVDGEDPSYVPLPTFDTLPCSSPACDPTPGNVLHIPCVISHWKDLDARKILTDNRAIIFDRQEIIPSDMSGSSGAETAASGSEWSLLKVIPPTASHKMITNLARRHLEAHAYERRTIEEAAGTSTPVSAADQIKFPVLNLLIALMAGDHNASPTINNAPFTGAENLQGVCLPGYGTHGGGEDHRLDDGLEACEIKGDPYQPFSTGSGAADSEEAGCNCGGTYFVGLEEEGEVMENMLWAFPKQMEAKQKCIVKKVWHCCQGNRR